MKKKISNLVWQKRAPENIAFRRHKNCVPMSSPWCKLKFATVVSIFHSSVSS